MKKSKDYNYYSYYSSRTNEMPMNVWFNYFPIWRIDKDSLYQIGYEIKIKKHKFKKSSKVIPSPTKELFQS